ncbi:hypothetical protein ACPCHW_25160 [Pseudomonas siliginis]|uniref:hypothetical protein n=1 Tax=Pseudomonas siliginis TaxID=2842346 RepID=UPI003C2AC06F
MNIYYTCEPGIKFHETPEHFSAPDFMSIALIAGTLQDLWTTWKAVSNFLAPEWPVTIKWRTIGYSLEQQKIQELRLQKEILTSLSPNGLLKKNEKTKIYSYVDFTNTNDIMFTPNELTQYRNTILILKKEEEDAYKIWSQLSENDRLNAAAIEKFLKSNRDTLIARFLESDTHSTAHIITSKKYSERITSILSKLNIEEIKPAKLYEIINKL